MRYCQDTEAFVISIMPINVAIVEDTDQIREGLRVLVGGSPGFLCTGAWRTAEEALRALPGSGTDVVLMDIQLPGQSGIECTRQLRQLLPSAQVVMLSIFDDDEKIYNSLVSGATGYILKNTPPAELLEAIRTVHGGGSPMSDRIARRVVEAFRTMGAAPSDTENLSEREMEILSLIAKGYRDKEIADKVFLSPDTVRTHVRNIYRKLHVRSRTQATLRFLGRS
jgi:DNA-binding NarL/FixJ family response regulator